MQESIKKTNCVRTIYNINNTKIINIKTIVMCYTYGVGWTLWILENHVRIQTNKSP
jgi:hypothetical protein